jgi:tetratricopeptide (TPR) repeat protein
MKAQLLFAQEQYDEAILSYSLANDIRKEVPTYLGLIESIMAVGQVKQALKFGKEAVNRMPRSSEIQLAFAKVLMNCANASDEVKMELVFMKWTPHHVIGHPSPSQCY